MMTLILGMGPPDRLPRERSCQASTENRPDTAIPRVSWIAAQPGNDEPRYLAEVTTLVMLERIRYVDFCQVALGLARRYQPPPNLETNTLASQGILPQRAGKRSRV